MPSLDYLLPCRLTSTDARTNTLSLFHLVEQVSVLDPSVVPVGRPAILPIEVVVAWRKGEAEPDGDYLQRLTLVDPEGTETELAVTGFHMAAIRHRVIPAVPPIQLPLEGTYRLRVYLAAAKEAPEWGPLMGEYAVSVSFGEKLIRIKLTDKQKEILAKEVRGQGGYQSLLRRLKGSIFGDELVLTTTDAERLIRSSQAYGEGGFQNRLRNILQQVRKQLDDIIQAEVGSVGGKADA